MIYENVKKITFQTYMCPFKFDMQLRRTLEIYDDDVLIRKVLFAEADKDKFMFSVSFDKPQRITKISDEYMIVAVEFFVSD